MDVSFVTDPLRADLRRVEEKVREAAAVEYPLLASLLNALIAAGGKQLRPAMLLLAAKMYSYPFDLLLPAAAGVQMLHTATLIHDDVIDQAGLRRGKPTLNSAFSTGTVILVGDFLFAKSASLASEPNNVRVMRAFANSLAAICNGQLAEIFRAGSFDQTRADYEQRIYGKTAALFELALEIGAELGGAPTADVDTLRAYGRNIGLAFQVIDDVLDFEATTEILGKPAGNDLRQGTITLPVLLYMEQCGGRGDGADLVRRVAESRDATAAEQQTAVNVIRASGVLNDACAEAERYSALAKECLAGVPATESRDLLVRLADVALQRAY
ncbi:MAG: polyprenyl synthetase family protein [Chloroflexi bacterium]|nr:polyprenyl synthetase family protein [Chloroflexota bacterium]